MTNGNSGRVSKTVRLGVKLATLYQFSRESNQDLVVRLLEVLLDFSEVN